MKPGPLRIALPKGRLTDILLELFENAGYAFSFRGRELLARDATGSNELILVKNTDLTTYVSHGIAGLGICGEDVLYESGLDFTCLLTFPFGGTKMCIAGRREIPVPDFDKMTSISVATKFVRFSRDFFHDMGIAAEIIKLNGSVELASVLGMTDYIVDLVETGNTLKENNLEIKAVLKKINVHFIANPSYYKVHYDRINSITRAVGRVLENGAIDKNHTKNEGD